MMPVQSRLGSVMVIVVMKFRICFPALLFFAISQVYSAQPNILLIMADDVGTDAIGCYGGQSYPTPHIDALATGGMKFDHAFAMPVCHPSRVCLMTGRYPFRFGAAGSRWGDYPDAAEGNSIGDVMRKGGYKTAVAGKWQMCFMKNDLHQPERTGFDEWCLFGWHEGGRYHDPFLYQNGEYRNDVSGQYGPDLYVEFLTDFMKRCDDEGKPFFAYYPMALCHDVTDDLKGRHVSFAKDGRWMTYAEMMASMDDMVGRLVEFLEISGLRKDTLVIFTTDNGTAGASYLTVNEDGKMERPKIVSVRNGEVVPGGKGKTDDTGTRVPFIANWPGKIEAGTESREMLDLTDLLPTVAEIGKVDISAMDLDGRSIAPVLQGTPDQAAKRDWIYIEHRGKRCIRSKNWKLYDDGRFFDLKNDPKEKHPVEAAGATYAKLKQQLDQMVAPGE